MKKFVIINFHSTLNSGDGGILLGQIQFLKKYYPGSEIVVTSRTPATDSRQSSFSDIEFLPPFLPTPVLFRNGRYKAADNFLNLFSVVSRIRLLFKLRKCDLVIVCGGGYLYSNRKIFPGPMLIQHLFHMVLAVWNKKPIVCFPQSIGPFYNKISETLVKLCLKSPYVKKIWTRELYSYDYLVQLLKNKENKIESCPDVGFFLNKAIASVNKKWIQSTSRPVIALTVRDWSFPATKGKDRKREKRDIYLDTLCETVAALHKERNASFIFIPHSRGIIRFEDDRNIIAELAPKLREVIPDIRLIEPSSDNCSDPAYILSLLSAANLVIATRLHSAIFAMVLRIPVITISYQHKGEGIMKMMGLYRNTVPISDLTSGILKTLADKTLDHYSREVNHLDSEMNRTRKEIEEILYKGIKSLLE